MRYRNTHEFSVTDGMTFEIAAGEEGDAPDGIVSPWLEPVDEEEQEPVPEPPKASPVPAKAAAVKKAAATTKEE